MAGQKYVECAFMIPLVRNGDRRRHPARAWRAYLDEVARTFVEGSTGPECLYRVAAPVLGLYRDDLGTTVEDRCWRYYLAIRQSQIEALRGVLRRACNTFDQEAIYLSVGGRVELVRGSRDDGFLGADQ